MKHVVLIAAIAAAIVPVAAGARHTTTTRVVMRHTEHHYRGPARDHVRRECRVYRQGHHKVRTCRAVRW